MNSKPRILTIKGITPCIPKTGLSHSFNFESVKYNIVYVVNLKKSLVSNLVVNLYLSRWVNNLEPLGSPPLRSTSKMLERSVYST